MILSKNILVYELLTVVFPNLVCPNLNFIDYVEVEIPSKVFPGNISNARVFPGNASFQLISDQEICRYVSMSNRELRMRRYFKFYVRGVKMFLLNL